MSPGTTTTHTPCLYAGVQEGGPLPYCSPPARPSLPSYMCVGQCFGAGGLYMPPPPPSLSLHLGQINKECSSRVWVCSVSALSGVRVQPCADQASCTSAGRGLAHWRPLHVLCCGCVGGYGPVSPARGDAPALRHAPTASHGLPPSACSHLLQDKLFAFALQTQPGSSSGGDLCQWRNPVHNTDPWPRRVQWVYPSGRRTFSEQPAITATHTSGLLISILYCAIL